MATKHRKKLVAIEWSWLIIGSAVVLVYTVEAWAAPYVPVLWMLGMLALFFAYRFAITFYEINWPEPEPTAAESAEQMKRHGGDGIAGTVVYALPQMRGRSLAEERERQRAEAAAKLELPSAEGEFVDDNLDTVFGIVAEDTAPTPALGSDAPRGPKVAGRPGLFGVTVYEYDDLRPETEDDVTGIDVPIPAFAESALTTLEREKALKLKQQQEKSPRLSAAVAAVVNRSESGAHQSVEPEKKPGLFGLDILEGDDVTKGLRPETEADVTGVDLPIPAFAESVLTRAEHGRSATPGPEAPEQPASSAPLNAKKQPPSRPKASPPMLDELTHVDRPVNLSRVTRGDLTLKELKRDDLARDAVKQNDLTLKEMKRDQLNLDEITQDEIDLGDFLLEDEIVLEEEIVFSEKTRQTKLPSAPNPRRTSSKESS
ncbi:hypothetical protein [Bradymonas sediminis]|uniref:Uncharacterized protein n=1 Tax=Bradymonas sediminis TaxID=1548548 RepID=A0A2Z4FNV9_9DELT|nr:hypothetical protein [Bradymonas sediminis]AWV90669.1 hypothetical protein DN745_15640 [Bradymonas sediminis]TDP62693.1 hypothetical protein DFR33_11299 [Bradymonas sediminis]